MEQFLSIKREFAELLAGQFSPYGVRVTGEFPPQARRMCACCRDRRGWISLGPVRRQPDPAHPAVRYSLSGRPFPRLP